MTQFAKKGMISPKEVEETTEMYLDKIKGKLGNVYNHFLADVQRQIDKEEEEKNNSPTFRKKK